MTEEHSPWARPEPGRDGTAGVVEYPSIELDRPEAAPARPGRPAAAAGYRTGTVTLLATPRTADVISNGPPDPPDDPARRNRRMLKWFGGSAGGVVLIGLVVLLGMIMTGNASGGLLHRQAGPPDTRSQLAKLCPPPTHDPVNPQQVPPAPPGPRTVDRQAGISYRAYGAPWEPWDEMWTAGTLHVSYRIGQHFITESYGSGYHASILSGSVPAATNDALVLDLKCTGRQVATDVRDNYYPQPNQMELLRDEQTFLGGRPAWVTKFRLHFHAAGLQATDELVGLALIDVGRPEAAILYVSIPGTHRQYDHVVDEVLDSVRPT
jgi:hypothetical protein